MRKFFTLLIVVVSCHYTQGQNELTRTVSGRLTGTDGTPLPGVSIVVKGTSTGTTTDADGSYSIEAPIGSTLVFAFVGMRTKEVLVTKDNLQPAKPSRVRSTKRSRKSEREIAISFTETPGPESGPGIATFTESTQSLKHRNIDPSTIRSIRSVGRRVVIKTDSDPVRVKGFGLQFTTSFGLDQINKLPELQSDFAQGRPVGGSAEWRGPDQSEFFSWGPGVRNLEFDGTGYPFDRNGRLVARGSGNGKQANRYDARSFFRSGLTTSNEVAYTLPAGSGARLIFTGERMDRSGIIPNSSYRKMNFSGKLRNFTLAENLRVNASISFNDSRGDLLMRGANYATIVGNVLRTPITFDNTNGLHPAEARHTEEAFYREDGGVRSHAAEIADNPYGLTAEAPDRESLKRFMASSNLHYTSGGKFSLLFNANVDRQSGNNVTGTPFGYSGFLSGMLTLRDEVSTQANASLTPTFTFDRANGNIKLNLSWITQFESRELERSNGLNFPSAALSQDISEANSIASIHNERSRAAHELAINAVLERYDWLTLRAGNRYYMSNTVNTRWYKNMLPYASMSVDLAELLSVWSSDGLRFYTAFSRTIQEAPLIYNDWAYASTTIPVQNYNSYVESGELFFHPGLSPERERKFESGFKGIFSRFWLELSYFRNITRDFISPVSTGFEFELRNAASIESQGATVSAEYFGHLRNGSWGLNIKWSKTQNYVDELYGQEEKLPLSGFATIHSALMRGEPVGAIFGTRYLRDDHNRKVIGNDGFPLEDPISQLIGNPIPDWTMGLHSYVNWRKLRLSFVFDIKKGGDIWNGTRAMLDYLGRSAETGALRNVTDYIFDGVDLNGNVNSVPVRFFDAGQAVEANRWTRYGWDGVGEDYIEDGSWFRLNELQLSCTIARRPQRSGVREMVFTVGSRNLFVITPYSGVDPSASLFGYSAGTGLDLFNAPATRSFNAQVTIKI